MRFRSRSLGAGDGNRTRVLSLRSGRTDENPYSTRCLGRWSDLATLTRHPVAVHGGGIARDEVLHTSPCMNTTHDPTTCPGCDRVLHLSELADWLDESPHTLYKWAAVGHPAFPRRIHLRNRRIAVTCRSVKAWLVEVAR